MMTDSAAATYATHASRCMDTLTCVSSSKILIMYCECIPEESYSACGPDGSAAGGGEERAHAVPCGADAARSWSESRVATDLLF